MKTRPADTRLKLALDGRNPDDGMNTIAYDKGYMLLRLMEETVGRTRFDAFLTAYFETYKFQSMDTERFLEILTSELLTPTEAAQIGLQDWVYQPGLPLNCPKPNARLFEAIDMHLKTLAKSQTLPSKEVTNGWSTHEWLHFLNNLPSTTDRPLLAKLDAAYGFTQSNNAEILAAWFNPVIRTQYKPAYPKMEQFLLQVGRRKFLMPAYRSLKATGQLALARNIYERARGNYHAVSRQSLDDLLGFE
jgi:leukotriene-A4 hydrolase